MAIVVPGSGSCLPPANPEGLRYRGECSDGKEVWIDAIFTSPGKPRGLFLQSESDSKSSKMGWGSGSVGGGVPEGDMEGTMLLIPFRVQLAPSLPLLCCC